MGVLPLGLGRPPAAAHTRQAKRLATGLAPGEGPIIYQNGVFSASPQLSLPELDFPAEFVQPDFRAKNRAIANPKLEDLQRCRPIDSGPTVSHTELLIDVPQVGLHRLRRNRKAVRDFLVVKTLSDEIKDIKLSVGERCLLYTSPSPRDRG